MDDDPADVKDPLLLLNTLNAGSPSYKIHNKRRLIPNFEVERQACGDVKKLKLKVPAQKLRNPSDDIIMVSPTGEIIPKKEWVDAETMVDELVNFMKVYKVPQARIARKLEIGQMWLSRMICAPRQYDILQESGRAQCRKLWGWLQIPEKERALEILNDQQADGKLLSFMHYISDRVEQDDNEEVDTIEMVRQMQEEMETYNVSVSDYAKGSGVKYSWVYALVNKPNVYDSFNVSGKKQARLLNRYLNLPLNQRAEMWKFTKDEPKGASLDTEDIRRRVEERLQRQNLPSQILCVQLQIDYPRFQQLFLQPIPWEHLNLPGRRVFSKLNDWLQSRGDDMQGVKTEVADEEEEEEDVIFHPTTTKKIVDNGNFYHSLDTFSLIKNVKREMKLLKLTPLQLGDHLNIRNLQDLMQNTGRWDKVDESMKEEYHLLNKWMASNPDKRIMEAQIIQGTFDPTTNYAQKLLAEQMRHEEDTLEPLITPQIKEEPGEKDNKPSTSTTTPTARQAWQTARPPGTRLPPVTRIVTLGFRSTKPPTKRIIPVPKLRPDVTNVNPNNDITITVDLPETAELIKAATLLIEQRIAFSVGLDKISMKSPREDIFMAHDDQSQAKEIIAKVMRQIKNDGTFGSLIKKAVFELEEEGFFDLLREDGKRNSDMVFKSCFADTNKQVDMNKDLKEKIIHETRAYVTRPQLQNTISHKIEKQLKINWFNKNEKLLHKIGDMARKELGLAPLYEIKEEVDIKEEPTSEGALESTIGTSRAGSSGRTNDDRVIKEESEDPEMTECNTPVEEGLTKTVPLELQRSYEMAAEYEMRVDQIEEAERTYEMAPDDGMRVDQNEEAERTNEDEEALDENDETQSTSGETQNVADSDETSSTENTSKSDSTSSSTSSKSSSPSQDTTNIVGSRKRFHQSTSTTSLKKKRRGHPPKIK